MYSITYIHSYIHTYIHTYIIYTYIRTYIHTYVHTYTHTYKHKTTHEHMITAHACMHAHTRTRAQVHTYTHLAHMHIIAWHMYVCMQACRHTHVPPLNPFFLKIYVFNLFCPQTSRQLILCIKISRQPWRIIRIWHWHVLSRWGDWGTCSLHTKSVCACVRLGMLVLMNTWLYACVQLRAHALSMPLPFAFLHACVCKWVHVCLSYIWQFAYLPN